VPERRVRRIFEPKRDEEIDRWRKLYNEELHQIILRRSNNGT
jgi:hypothetical protein